MVMPETPLEFFLNGRADRVYERLRSRGCLSEHGLAERPQVLREIERTRKEHDPHITGPSYVHKLAQALIALGMFSERGLSLHNSGPRSLPELWADFEDVKKEILEDT